MLNVPARVFISQSSAMTATATRADRSVQDVTSLANWSSSNANIATVTPAGALQGVAGGTATITATYLGVSTTAAVQVFAGPALTVTIDGVPVQAAVTATESMETTGTYTGPFAFVTGTSTANRRVHVNVPFAVGTYDVRASVANISILDTSGGWSATSFPPKGSGAVTVVNITSNRISGTFSGVLTEVAGGTPPGTRVLADGVFDATF